MRPGFVMLSHEAMDRAGQVAASLAGQGAPVVVHVDRKVRGAELAAFHARTRGVPGITQMPRRRCEWGTWSLVAVTNEAVRRLLRDHPEVTHVCLISGTCLPLRPVSDLAAFLAREPDADFIESVSVSEVPWIQGGLGAERFDYSFPFAWKRSRGAFDRWVRLQRRLGRKRRIPSGLSPHLGSQWWCLRRETLTAILDDPERRRFDRYFRRTWIPDESYYQTLARRHARRIVSRSLTHARFDWKGRPHLLYDDHLETLSGVDAFFARKVWRGADLLYRTFLQPRSRPIEDDAASVPDIWGIARRSSVQGRTGLLNAGRFPWWGYPGALTAQPYVVFSGFDDIYEDFNDWLLRQRPDLVAHGRLFDARGAAFADGRAVTAGGISARAGLRDYNPESFLCNLVRVEDRTQSFHLSPSDRADLWPMIARDSHARIFAIRGGFLRSLAEAGGVDMRRDAALWQEREENAATRLSDPSCRATVETWSLADVALDPVAPIRAVLAALDRPATGPVSMPRLKPLDEIETFLSDLANAGVTPRVAGDASVWRRLARTRQGDVAEHG